MLSRESESPKHCVHCRRGVLLWIEDGPADYVAIIPSGGPGVISSNLGQRPVALNSHTLSRLVLALMKSEQSDHTAIHQLRSYPP